MTNQSGDVTLHILPMRSQKPKEKHKQGVGTASGEL
jgi:hypothetical protein